MNIRCALALVFAGFVSCEASAISSHIGATHAPTDSFMLSFNDLNVSRQAALTFNEGIKLSLMMLPTRYNDALLKLNQAKELGHPYASIGILLTNALANHYIYNFKDYSNMLLDVLEGEDPLGVTLAAFTIIEATDFLKYNDGKPLLVALNRALAQNYVPAWYVKGLVLIKLGYLSTGVDEIKQAADLNYVIAQYHMAFLILSGHLKMDKAYAFSLLEKALAGGHLSAYREIGLCYELGLGTTSNINKALDMYYQGFKYGDISAAASYGLLMLRQPNTNYIECFNALSFAYNNGVSEVANALGTLYLKGLGVKMNQSYGFELIKEAADSNDPLAINNLILCYQNGHGTTRDLSKAALYKTRLHALLLKQQPHDTKMEAKQRRSLQSDKVKSPNNLQVDADGQNNSATLVSKEPTV